MTPQEMKELRERLEKLDSERTPGDIAIYGGQEPYDLSLAIAEAHNYIAYGLSLEDAYYLSAAPDMMRLIRAQEAEIARLRENTADCRSGEKPMTPQEMKELQDRLNARLKRDGKEHYFWEVCVEDGRGKPLAILRDGIRARVPHTVATGMPEDKEERLYTLCLSCLEKHLEHQEEQNQ